MSERVIECKPNPKQLKFLKARRMYVGFGGARGGGKSWSIQTKATLLANRWPDIKICIVRKSLVELRNNHIEPLKKELRGIARFNRETRSFLFPNGASITFEYYKSDGDKEKFQGVEYDVIFVDEATQMQPEWLDIITTACRGVNDNPHRVYYTCNPGGPGHTWVKRRFIDRAYKGDENPEDYEFIQSLVTDNKVLMEADPKYVSFLKNLPPKLKKAWLYGDWDVFEGMFFEEFRNNPDGYDTHQWSHVITPFPPKRHWPIYRSFDWGFRRPFSVGWWSVNEDGVIYRIDEMYGVQYSEGEPIPDTGLKWAPMKVFTAIKKHEEEHPWLKGKNIIGVADSAIWDGEQGESIADTAAKCGIFFQQSDKARIPGWMQMHYRFMFDEDGYARMYIFSTCKNFIRTITTLEYDEHETEDLDSSGEDHAADETRYFCMLPKIKVKEELVAELPAWGGDPLDQFARRNMR